MSTPQDLPDPSITQFRGLAPAAEMDYEVEISRPRFLYRIDISQGLLEPWTYHALTFNGARRKAERVIRRYRRRFGRPEVLERFIVEADQ